MAPQILMQVGPCRPNKMGKKGGCRHTPVCPESLHPPQHGPQGATPGHGPRRLPHAAAGLRQGGYATVCRRLQFLQPPKRGPLRVTPKGGGRRCVVFKPRPP